jgi:CRISPR type I-D-associated protein Csc1
MSDDFRTHLVVARLDDYLWFASHEWGNDNETAPVLHGYALSFALSGRDRVIAVGGVPSYDEDLAGIDIYCTPARLLVEQRASGRRGLFAVFTFNSIDNPTQLTQAMRREGSNDPKFGKRQVLLPGLRFEFVTFSRRDAVLPRVFRLGKKRSPVVVEQATAIEGKPFHGAATPDHAVNPRDVSGRVMSCIPRVIPPHLVYERATIEEDDFLRSERTVVHIPERVRAWTSS